VRKTLICFGWVLLLPGCGSGTDSGGAAPAQAPSGTAFDPPATPAGYVRLDSKTVSNIPPGGDVTYCQYVMAPFDHDVDVLDVRGIQSSAGHHAAVFTYAADGSTPIGTSEPCMGTEFTSGGLGADAGNSTSSLLAIGAYLGAIGGATGGSSAATLPAGVAFRMKKGNGIMLNVHYLNTTREAVDGNTAVDIKFADADPSRTIAAMFVNVNIGFNIAPDSHTSSSIDCVAQGDLNLLLMANHMHEFGTSASTQVIPAGSTTPTMLHEDKTWTYEMQFNPVYTDWSVATPYAVHSGDTIRTTCNWANTTSEAMTFPREMCVGVGFALAPSGTDTVPMCAQGAWIPTGI